MCGIGCLLRCTGAPELPSWLSAAPCCRAQSDHLPSLQALSAVLKRRGPDAISSVSVCLSRNVLWDDVTEVVPLSLVATTLSLRHVLPPMHPFPLLDEEEISVDDAERGYLLYNGELYDISESELNPSCSDTQHLADVLKPLLSVPQDRVSVEKNVLSALDDLRGPFCFLLWAPRAKRLYFARDVIGRRSLLIAARAGSGIALTSVAPPGHSSQFVEVPPVGLCYMDFSSGIDASAARADARGIRSETWPRFGVVRRLHREVVPRGLRLPGNTKKDMQTSEDAREVALNVSFLPANMLRCGRDLAAAMSADAQDAVVGFLAALEVSVSRRLAHKPSRTYRRFSSRQGMDPRFAVLFSGGIDSLVVALVLDRMLPSDEPIDLINVAFGKTRADCDACPDRISSIAGLAELLDASTSDRKIRLLCADVSPDAADSILENHVRHLIHPCTLPMDASIGTALWVAARGRGYEHNSSMQRSRDSENQAVADDAVHRDIESPEHVITPARVLFSGLGADELMGGYKGRHRTSFRLGGPEAVARDIDGDLSRLWLRNLGRDDRLVSDSGRELRHPFLDEDLIRYVNSLPLTECVCDLALPDGVGDKQLLRRAALRLGLPPSASRRAKRAIQFGSRSKHILERTRS